MKTVLTPSLQKATSVQLVDAKQGVDNEPSIEILLDNLIPFLNQTVAADLITPLYLPVNDSNGKLFGDSLDRTVGKYSTLATANAPEQGDKLPVRGGLSVDENGQISLFIEVDMLMTARYEGKEPGKSRPTAMTTPLVMFTERVTITVNDIAKLSKQHYDDLSEEESKGVFTVKPEIVNPRIVH